MVKSKEYMALYRARSVSAMRVRRPSMSIRVYDSPHENELIGNRTVGSILDEAERRNAIDYDKPRSGLRREDEGSRDLFAHAALYLAGWRGFTVLGERNSSNTPKEEWKRYKKSIDLKTSDGAYWEIKSPPPGKNPGSTRAVERSFRRAADQFAGHPIGHGQPRRVVFNGRYLKASDASIRERILKEMRLQGIDEVVQIRKDGSIRHFRP